MVVTKTNLVDKIAEKMNISKKEATEFINTYQNLIIDEVVEGNEVKLSGFVSFAPVDKKARTARHPQTGEKIEVEAHRGVSVRPFKSFKETVRNS